MLENFHEEIYLIKFYKIVQTASHYPQVSVCKLELTTMLRLIQLEVEGYKQ